MNVSILAIGDELLIGKIVNTNTAFIAKKLNTLGFTCVEQSVVGDYEEDIVKELNLLSSVSDLIIVTGGLGLTDDDKTKKVIANYCGKQLVYNETAASIALERYSARHKTVTEQMHGFDFIPEGAKVLPNDTGIACGFITGNGKVKIAVFPGPPCEMEPMFDRYFMSELSSMTNRTLYTQYFKIFGIRELDVFNKVADLFPLEKQGILLTTYTSTHEVALVMRFDDKTDKSLVDDTIVKISEKFGKNIFSFANEELEQTLYGLLKLKNKKIAVAESLTGGMISDKIVSVPGISKYFNEGIVTYTNEAKISRLNVNADTIELHGAVSEETAREMCQGLFMNPLTDVAVSTTGDAGPTTEPLNDTVGKCFIAVGTKDNVKVFEHHFVGNRTVIREACAKQSLFYLINLLKYNEI